MDKARARLRFMGWVLVVGVIAPLLLATSSASPYIEGNLTLHVEDEAGRPLTARVRVAPFDWTERARLGLWNDLSMLAPQGRAQTKLVAGHYRVIVTHGTEWTLAELDVRMDLGHTVQRTVRLRRQVWLPGWRAADLHVHTERSDDADAHGGVSVAALQAEGVEIAVSTDHNQIGKLAAGMDSIAGAEITTWQPEVGHFNAFPLSRMPAWRGTSPQRLFDEVTQDPHVFVQINHPQLEDHIAYFTLGGFDGEGFARSDFNLNAHGLEVWNGYDIAQPDRVDALLKLWRAWIARGNRLTATGGSDCHGAPGHHPGYPRTYVQTQHSDQLAGALQQGRAFVSNGPLLSLSVNQQQAGDTVELTDDHVQATIHVLAPDWMTVERAEIWAGDELVWSRAIPRATSFSDAARTEVVAAPLQFTASVRVVVGHARTLHAVARGGSGLDRLLGRSGVEPMAFTNPIHLSHAGGQHASR